MFLIKVIYIYIYIYHVRSKKEGGCKQTDTYKEWLVDVFRSGFFRDFALRNFLIVVSTDNL